MKKLIVHLLTVDKPTTNGRIYPRSVVQAALDRVNNKTTCFGTIGQPKGPAVVVAEASHIITDMQLVQDSLTGDHLMCTINILDTGCGRTLRRLMEIRPIEFKIWGIGSVDAAGVVSNDYEILGAYAELK